MGYIGCRQGLRRGRGLGLGAGVYEVQGLHTKDGEARWQSTWKIKCKMLTRIWGRGTGLGWLRVHSSFRVQGTGPTV